nr:hypothetical protein [Tanacetum cinerariifolium]
MLPIELTNADIRNSEAYKEYYAVATRATPPKTKASVQKTKSSSDTTVTPSTAAAGTRLFASAKDKQPAKASKAKSLTAFSEFAGAVSSIPGIVQTYMDQRMNEAVKVAIQIQSDRLCDEAQADNEEFLKNLDENIQKIIKEQILIEKIEGNKSIHRSNEQMNLYKALVEAYESDKIILDTYGDTVTLKRRRDDDADKDEEPSAGSDRGSKRRREGKKPESASAPKEKATRSAGKSTQGSKSRQTSASESATAEEPMQTTHEIEEPSHPEFETSADDQPIAKPSKHPEWESARDVYSKRRIIAVTELKIVEWHNYKHLDWITVRRDDDKLYKFKEGDFKRLHIQDIEDMLLLLVQGKLTNMTVEERFDFNVSLRMFTRSIIIQRHMEDLQLSVESY